MNEPESGKLPVLKIAGAAYMSFRRHLKQHIILSYVFFLPLTLLMLLPSLHFPLLRMQESGVYALEFSAFYIAFLAISFIVFSTLTLVFYRLHLFGRTEYLKLPLSTLGRMLVKYILYVLAMIGLLAIFGMMMLVLAGLIQGIINGITGGSGSPRNDPVMALFYITIVSVVLSGIGFRMQTTFVSIAENSRFLTFKEAWYYSKNNGIAIFAAMVLCLLPAFLVSSLLIEAVTALLGVQQTVDINNIYVLVQYLLSPVMVAWLSLSSACMVQVYRFLVRPAGKAGHIADLIV